MLFRDQAPSWTVPETGSTVGMEEQFVSDPGSPGTLQGPHRDCTPGRLSTRISALELKRIYRRCCRRRRCLSKVTRRDPRGPHRPAVPIRYDAVLLPILNMDTMMDKVRTKLGTVINRPADVRGWRVLGRREAGP